MKLTDIIIPKREDGTAAIGRVILSGMLEDGPPGKPFSLPSDTVPSIALGLSPTTHLAEILLNTGVPSESIFYNRMNGIPYSISLPEEESPCFLIRSIGAHEEDQNISISFSLEGLTLSSTYTKTGTHLDRKNFTRTYRYEDCPYLYDLESAINQDALLGLVDVVAETIVNKPSKDAFPSGVKKELQDGSDEAGFIHMDEPTEDSLEQIRGEYEEKFKKYILGEHYDGLSYEAIADLPAEAILFPDINVDTFKEIGPLIAGLAAQKTEDQGVVCYAYLNTSPFPKKETLPDGTYLQDDGTYWDESMQESRAYNPIAVQLEYIQKITTLYSEEERANPYMKNLMLVVGDDDREKRTPGLGSLVALILQTPAGKPVSNQPLKNFYQLNAEITQSMVATMTSNGYICIVPSLRKGFVPQYVQSYGLQAKETVLSDWNNHRLIGVIKAHLVTVLDQHIGKSFGIFTKSKIESEISDVLENIPGSERLMGFELGAIDQDIVNGTLSIPLTLYLPQDVKGIESTLQMSQEGWQINLWSLTA